MIALPLELDSLKQQGGSGEIGIESIEEGIDNSKGIKSATIESESHCTRLSQVKLSIGP